MNPAISEYKIDTQKSGESPYTNNELSEKKKKKNYPLSNSIKKKKKKYLESKEYI